MRENEPWLIDGIKCGAGRILGGAGRKDTHFFQLINEPSPQPGFKLLVSADCVWYCVSKVLAV